MLGPRWQSRGAGQEERRAAGARPVLKPSFLFVIALATSAPAGVVVPFKWTPGQIEVDVRVAGAAATFLLDTGSEYSIVSARLARVLGLQTAPRLGREFADGVRLQVGAVDLGPQPVMVMPFETYYARGRQIDGLLGFDVFERFVVSIDFASRRLMFHTPDSFPAPQAAVHVPITFAGRLPVVEGVLRLGDGRALPARLMVDTGASQSIMLRHPYATANGIFQIAGGERTAPSLASGPRRLVEVPAEQLAVSGLTFDRPEVLAFTEPVGSAASTQTDGLIGNALLSRYTLHVDYARRRLLFEPRRIRN